METVKYNYNFWELSENFDPVTGKKKKVRREHFRKFTDLSIPFHSNCFEYTLFAGVRI